MTPLKIREVEGDLPFAVFAGRGVNAYDLKARFPTREAAEAWIPGYRREVRRIIRSARRRSEQHGTAQ